MALPNGGMVEPSPPPLFPQNVPGIEVFWRVTSGSSSRGAGSALLLTGCGGKDLVGLIVPVEGQVTLSYSSSCTSNHAWGTHCRSGGSSRDRLKCHWTHRPTARIWEVATPLGVACCRKSIQCGWAFTPTGCGYAGSDPFFGFSLPETFMNFGSDGSFEFYPHLNCIGNGDQSNGTYV